jgi:hypothetical protein
MAISSINQPKTTYQIIETQSTHIWAAGVLNRFHHGRSGGRVREPRRASLALFGFRTRLSDALPRSRAHLNFFRSRDFNADRWWLLNSDLHVLAAQDWLLRI